MDNNLLSDKPVEKQPEDRFQRYEFSKRIAQTIIDRKSEDCLVIGIYGAWGEGKTSVLNFIEQELKKDEENTFVIKFNPWRYNDENKLLKFFFKEISDAFDEQLENVIQRFGKRISII